MSVIDLRELLESVRKVFQVVTVAIDVVGSLVILTGGLILVGAVAVTKFQRVYEAAIFKTLGASSRAIAAMLMVEYGLLGTIAGAVGSFGALALGWGVSRFALDIPWRPVAPRKSRRYGRDIAAHHDHRRRGERGRPQAQAACGAACRIVKMSSCLWT